MRRVMALLVGAVMVAGGCTARPRAAPVPPPLPVVAGQVAPQFTFTTLTGRRVEAASRHEKPFILFFFASWCEYCWKQAPDIEKLHQKSRAAGVPMFGIGINGYPDVLRTKAKGMKLTFPVALSAEMAESYGATLVPFTVFVNEQGRVSWTVTGAAPYEQLELGLKSIRPPRTAPAGGAGRGRT